MTARKRRDLPGQLLLFDPAFIPCSNCGRSLESPASRRRKLGAACARKLRGPEGRAEYWTAIA